LLEEALAWLLRNSGYRLLVHAKQDPDELEMQHGALHVRGRGAIHQADALGEFAITPGFSLPIRLFLEAKYYRSRCQLQVVRNAHGVVHDVNENFIQIGSSRPRRRFQYAYALFSASGFTVPAQEYALAQQISLIDLSGESFNWLREAVWIAASELYTLRDKYHIRTFPVSWMRTEIRGLLGTAITSGPEPFLEPGTTASTNAPRFRITAQEVIAEFTSKLRMRESTELILGFPAAPFILPLASDDPAQFIAYIKQHPAHAVRLRRRGSGQDAEWTATPAGTQENTYKVSFKLPEKVESWISENEKWRRARTADVKGDLLSRITIYRHSSGETQIYQLRYEPNELASPVP